LRIFVLTAASLGSEAAIQILLKAETRIGKVLDRDAGPFIYRGSKDGRVVQVQ